MVSDAEQKILEDISDIETMYKKRIRGNYDLIRTVAFAMVLIQHFLVTCLRCNIALPIWALWIIGGGGVERLTLVL